MIVFCRCPTKSIAKYVMFILRCARKNELLGIKTQNDKYIVKHISFDRIDHFSYTPSTMPQNRTELGLKFKYWDMILNMVFLYITYLSNSVYTT